MYIRDYKVLQTVYFEVNTREIYTISDENKF